MKERENQFQVFWFSQTSPGRRRPGRGSRLGPSPSCTAQTLASRPGPKLCRSPGGRMPSSNIVISHRSRITMSLNSGEITDDSPEPGGAGVVS